LTDACGCPTPSLSPARLPLDAWHLKESDLKKYPHFDSFISIADAEILATDPIRVAQHKFFPFILYEQRYNRFAKKGMKGKVKLRPIRYAPRRDAYIYLYYRYILSKLYEVELTKLGLHETVLAYRRIPTTDGTGGRCNIHHCQRAVSRIREYGNCYTIALDISSYFESIDHHILKSLWCRLLGCDRLPADHFKVFETITEYSVVKKLDAYERLGYFGAKSTSGDGKSAKGYLVPYKQIPFQLCSAMDFRSKIAGGDGRKSVITKNRKPFGIPQGAPISDFLANLYLIDFDTEVAKRVGDAGGDYFRYSDDILIVAPGNESKGQEMMEWVQSIIKHFGAKLIIKETKSSLILFTRNKADQDFCLVHGTQGKNGLEYLGFRYNGKHVYLRDTTLSSLMRKIASSVKSYVHKQARRYSTKSHKELESLLDCERIIKRFGRVEGFFERKSNYRNWTFWTYARKAIHVLGPLGKPIGRQLRRHRVIIKNRIAESLEDAVYRRELNRNRGVGNR
jgi:Reverse transcriptase (RNA-dependent DNA polymerase)